jgi:hypothetical protein
MGKVIPLITIPPKSESIEHEGQRFTITYDPNAPEHQRWVWEVRYKVTYPFFGAQPTREAARQRAVRKINSLVAREEDGE